MKKSSLHGLLMVACCIVPMLAFIVLLPLVKANASGFNWTWLLFLLCPLMHLLMMRGMGENKCHENKKKENETTE